MEIIRYTFSCKIFFQEQSVLFDKDCGTDKLLKYTKSIKRTIKKYNVPEVWKVNSSRIGSYDSVEKTLNKIEQLDKTLTNMDYSIIKHTAPVK